MTRPASPAFGRALFASKGKAAPTTAAMVPLAGPPTGGNEVGRAAGPQLGRAAASPLSFLIGRRPLLPGGDGVPKGVAVPGRGRPEVAALQDETRPPPAGPRRLRRSLTLRLELGDYLLFRQQALGRQATFQSLLESLVLRFLAADAGQAPTLAPARPPMAGASAGASLPVSTAREGAAPAASG